MFIRLLSITKLQNLKAIHNIQLYHNCVIVVVINHKTTKFESNSQLKIAARSISFRCYQSQNYKIWKQFTTVIGNTPHSLRLLSITKLQNLKAIHNKWSQVLHVAAVVINHKTTKFESNSQPRVFSGIKELSCYQSQNYKIWKQFTTKAGNNKGSCRLLSITKLQNLKAIHNYL